jgi:ribosomal protein S19
VFTARYALSPYIKQIRFVFKGLMWCKDVPQNLACTRATQNEERIRTRARIVTILPVCLSIMYNKNINEISITKNQGGKEYPTNNNKKEG